MRTARERSRDLAINDAKQRIWKLQSGNGSRSLERRKELPSRLTEENIQPCVVITPPSLRAPKSSSKYGFWNKLSAGPSGSEESVMMTSNSFL